VHNEPPSSRGIISVERKSVVLNLKARACFSSDPHVLCCYKFIKELLETVFSGNSDSGS
jgi:hypothetical protein